MYIFTWHYIVIIIQAIIFIFIFLGYIGLRYDSENNLPPEAVNLEKSHTNIHNKHTHT